MQAQPALRMSTNPTRRPPVHTCSMSSQSMGSWPTIIADASVRSASAARTGSGGPSARSSITSTARPNAAAASRAVWSARSFGLDRITSGASTIFARPRAAARVRSTPWSVSARAASVPSAE